jgi:cytochrome c oxidase assembly protein subunit 15
MVKSGLDEKLLVTSYPTVSPYRLAAHLTSAFVIFSYIMWTALSLSYPRAMIQPTRELIKSVKTCEMFFVLFSSPFFYFWPQLLITCQIFLSCRYRRLVAVAAATVCTTILSGAFVAGLDAGLVYNEFPFMGNSIIPVEWADYKPLWKNFTENSIAVQFNHRVLVSHNGIWI